MLDLSIVIVNYNTRDYLRPCLASIDAQRGDLAVEVIVVDNASKDGSAAMVRAEFPRVVLVEPGVNTWFTGGNNLGVSRAQRRIRPAAQRRHARSSRGCCRRWSPICARIPNVGALTCQQRSFDGGEMLRICSRVPALPRSAARLHLSRRDLRAPGATAAAPRMWYADWGRDTTRAVEVIPGSCILAPRDLLLRLGTFDDAPQALLPRR